VEKLIFYILYSVLPKNIFPEKDPLLLTWDIYIWESIIKELLVLCTGKIDILYLNTGSKNVLNIISYLVISHLDDITCYSKQYILYGCFALVAG